jgi:prevent-host-death family protein
MHSVGIKALKAKLSRYVRAVATGETVLVTDRGRVVAEIIPPRAQADASTAAKQWAELIRRGLVTPAKRPRPRLPPRSRNLVSFEELMCDLDDSRSDR